MALQDTCLLLTALKMENQEEMKINDYRADWANL